MWSEAWPENSGMFEECNRFDQTQSWSSTKLTLHMKVNLMQQYDFSDRVKPLCSFYSFWLGSCSKSNIYASCLQLDSSFPSMYKQTY